MDILLAFLIGAVVIAVLMHLHFKNLPDVRVALVSPEVYSVIGCLVGIAVGMIWQSVHAQPGWNGRIYIEQGVIHALAGAVAGAFVGIGARAIYARGGRGRIIGHFFTLVLLGASIGAPIGWLYGDLSRKGPEFPEEMWEFTRRGMMWGSGIGCSVGFSLGILEACFGARRIKTGAAKTPDR